MRTASEGGPYNSNPVRRPRRRVWAVLAARIGNEAAARLLDEVLDRQLVALTNQSSKELVAARYEKFRRMGQFFDLGS